MKRYTVIGGWRLWALLLVLAAPLGISSVARAQPSSTDANVQTAIAGLDALAQQYMSRTGIPGMAIAVVYKDQVAYMKGFGVREAGTEARVDPDTVFQLASMSKPIATTTVAALVGDGVLSWDDPIVKHDPGFQMDQPWVTDRVTPRDMFSHSSGLPDCAGDLLEDMEFSREQILSRLRYLDTGDHFRAQYAYTNFGFTEAGVAAAKAASTTWESLIVERLFKPLGMTSSSPRSADLFAARTAPPGTCSSMAATSQSTGATRIRRRRRAASVHRCGTCRSGCACSLATAWWTASRSWPRRRWRRRTGRISSAHRRPTRPWTAPASTASAGTSPMTDWAACS